MTWQLLAPRECGWCGWPGCTGSCICSECGEGPDFCADDCPRYDDEEEAS